VRKHTDLSRDFLHFLLSYRRRDKSRKLLNYKLNYLENKQGIRTAQKLFCAFVVA